MPAPPNRGTAATPDELPKLRPHFSIPIYADELLYDYEHLRDLMPHTPTFEVNVYDLLLRLNRFEADWSTLRA